MTEILGREFPSDPRMAQGKKLILEAIAERSRRIIGITPSNEAALQAAAEKFAKVRGKEFFYPSIGSGIGNGPFVELADGSVKLDLIAGIGVHFFGHSDLDLISTSLDASAKDVVMQGNLLPNEEYYELLKILLEHAPKRMKYGWLSLSGSMANENAIKIIRQKKYPAYMIVTFDHAFAGRTSMMAEITDNPLNRVGLPVHGETLYVPFYDPSDPNSTAKSVSLLETFIRRYPGKIAAFLFELIQGEGGFNVAPPAFFRAMMECCRKHDLVIWIDEVQTFGRTGELFATQKLELEEYADVISIGKMLQNCALLFSEELNPKPGLVVGTFAGSTVSLSVGRRIVERLVTEGFFGPNGKISAVEKRVFGKLKELQHTLPKGAIADFGGMGGMISVTPLDGSLEGVKEVVRESFNRGLLIWHCGHGPYKLRFLLPCGALTDQHIDLAMQLMGEAIEAVRQRRK
ncbi:MAG: aminotransferase class III-fold pyridoxal phosphate-dependent enzyme [Deltaproteobacteria bacterium]|nr:aminotransferase class III-fold pyridoxal phosphate-dependent enzyme [Deltaproteobacteria bacterium]